MANGQNVPSCDPLTVPEDEDLQNLVSEVFKICFQLGLKISLTKTQVQVIGLACDKINTHLVNHTLEEVKSFI